MNESPRWIADSRQQLLKQRHKDAPCTHFSLYDCCVILMSFESDRPWMACGWKSWFAEALLTSPSFSLYVLVEFEMLILHEFIFVWGLLQLRGKMHLNDGILQTVSVKIVCYGLNRNICLYLSPWVSDSHIAKARQECRVGSPPWRFSTVTHQPPPWSAVGRVRWWSGRSAPSSAMGTPSLASLSMTTTSTSTPAHTPTLVHKVSVNRSSPRGTRGKSGAKNVEHPLLHPGHPLLTRHQAPYDTATRWNATTERPQTLSPSPWPTTRRGFSTRPPRTRKTCQSRPIQPALWRFPITNCPLFMKVSPPPISRPGTDPGCGLWRTHWGLPETWGRTPGKKWRTRRGRRFVSGKTLQ